MTFEDSNNLQSTCICADGPSLEDLEWRVGYKSNNIAIQYMTYYG